MNDAHTNTRAHADAHACGRTRVHLPACTGHLRGSRKADHRSRQFPAICTSDQATVGARVCVYACVCACVRVRAFLCVCVRARAACTRVCGSRARSVSCVHVWSSTALILITPTPGREGTTTGTLEGTNTSTPGRDETSMVDTLFLVVSITRIYSNRRVCACECVCARTCVREFVGG